MTGSPILALRSNLPLKPVISYSEAENPEFKVPKFTHAPETIGYFGEFRHGTNIPGKLLYIIYMAFFRYNFFI